MLSRRHIMFDSMQDYLRVRDSGVDDTDSLGGQSFGPLVNLEIPYSRPG
jgi:hypothetical protein